MSSVTNGDFIEESDFTETVISNILNHVGMNHSLMKIDTWTHIPGSELYADRIVVTLTTAAKDDDSDHYIYLDYTPGSFPCYGQLLDCIYGIGRDAEYRVIVLHGGDDSPFTKLVRRCNQCGLPIYLIKETFKDEEKVYRILESPMTPTRDISQLPTKRTIEMLYFWEYCFRPEKVMFGCKYDDYRSIFTEFNGGMFEVEWDESGLKFIITNDSQPELIDHLFKNMDDFFRNDKLRRICPEMKISLTEGTPKISFHMNTIPVREALEEDKQHDYGDLAWSAFLELRETSRNLWERDNLPVPSRVLLNFDELSFDR